MKKTLKDIRKSGHVLETAGVVHSPGDIIKVDDKKAKELLNNPNFKIVKGGDKK